MPVVRLDMDRVEGFVTDEECCMTTTSTTRWSENPDYCCTTTTTSSTTTTTSSTTTTTTTLPPPDCLFDGYAETVVACLEGITIETIYIYSIADLSLLPVNYTHPCPSEIGAHVCNRACFEVYGNGIYIGDSLMNNAGGTGGSTTAGGNLICQDYNNVPAALTGGIWSGNPYSRYSVMTIDGPTAAAIAAAGGGGTTINFALVSAMVTYGQTCDTTTIPHSNITWTRITDSYGNVMYNGCPEGNFLSLDICATPTTTTSTSSTTTTTTTIVPENMLEFNSNETGIVITDFSVATPYPVTFTVSGITAPIAYVELDLIDYSHTYVADVGMCLVASNASYNCMISGNNGGGIPAVNANITLTPYASLVWNGYSSGTFLTPNTPSINEVFTAPAPTYLISTIYPAMNVFTGVSPLDANGTWKLYIQDFFGGDSGTLTSAKLRIYF